MEFFRSSQFLESTCTHGPRLIAGNNRRQRGPTINEPFLFLLLHCWKVPLKRATQPGDTSDFFGNSFRFATAQNQSSSRLFVFWTKQKLSLFSLVSDLQPFERILGRDTPQSDESTNLSRVAQFFQQASSVKHEMSLLLGGH